MTHSWLMVWSKHVFFDLIKMCVFTNWFVFYFAVILCDIKSNFYFMLNFTIGRIWKIHRWNYWFFDSFLLYYFNFNLCLTFLNQFFSFLNLLIDFVFIMSESPASIFHSIINVVEDIDISDISHDNLDHDTGNNLNFDNLSDVIYQIFILFLFYVKFLLIVIFIIAIIILECIFPITKQQLLTTIDDNDYYELQNQNHNNLCYQNRNKNVFLTL